MPLRVDPVPRLLSCVSTNRVHHRQARTQIMYRNPILGNAVRQLLRVKARTWPVVSRALRLTRALVRRLASVRMHVVLGLELAVLRVHVFARPSGLIPSVVECASDMLARPWRGLAGVIDLGPREGSRVTCEVESVWVHPTAKLDVKVGARYSTGSAHVLMGTATPQEYGWVDDDAWQKRANGIRISSLGKAQPREETFDEHMQCLVRPRSRPRSRP